MLILVVFMSCHIGFLKYMITRYAMLRFIYESRSTKPETLSDVAILAC